MVTGKNVVVVSIFKTPRPGDNHGFALPLCAGMDSNQAERLYEYGNGQPATITAFAGL
jgi:hypothetical protein